MNEIRDIRESKNLSQDAVAEAAGVSYSVFVRIEAGTGKTTEAEVKHVLATVRKMKKSDRKIGGRPFGDPAKQAAAQAAREAGGSVSAALAGEEIGETPEAAPEKPKRAPRARKLKADEDLI